MKFQYGYHFAIFKFSSFIFFASINFFYDYCFVKICGLTTFIVFLTFALSKIVPGKNSGIPQAFLVLLNLKELRIINYIDAVINQ